MNNLDLSNFNTSSPIIGGKRYKRKSRRNKSRRKQKHHTKRIHLRKNRSRKHKKTYRQRGG